MKRLTEAQKQERYNIIESVKNGDMTLKQGSCKLNLTLGGFSQWARRNGLNSDIKNTRLSKIDKLARIPIVEKIRSGILSIKEGANILNISENTLYMYMYYNDSSNKGEERKDAYKNRRIKRNNLCKSLILNHYGNECVCCGESNYKFLTVDHINGGGRRHREQRSITDINSWLINNNYPDGYQILCFNCNCAKGIYGICPHKEVVDGGKV